MCSEEVECSWDVEQSLASSNHGSADEHLISAETQTSCIDLAAVFNRSSSANFCPTVTRELALLPH